MPSFTDGGAYTVLRAITHRLAAIDGAGPVTASIGKRLGAKISATLAFTATFTPAGVDMAVRCGVVRVLRLG